MATKNFIVPILIRNKNRNIEDILTVRHEKKKPTRRSIQ